jgi:hypothetical protein
MSTWPRRRLNRLTGAGWVGAFALLLYPPAFGRGFIGNVLCVVVIAARLAYMSALNRAKGRDVPASTTVASEG